MRGGGDPMIDGVDTQRGGFAGEGARGAALHVRHDGVPACSKTSWLRVCVSAARRCGRATMRIPIAAVIGNRRLKGRIYAYAAPACMEPCVWRDAALTRAVLGNRRIALTLRC